MDPDFFRIIPNGVADVTRTFAISSRVSFAREEEIPFALLTGYGYDVLMMLLMMLLITLFSVKRYSESYGLL